MHTVSVFKYCVFFSLPTINIKIIAVQDQLPDIIWSNINEAEQLKQRIIFI